MERYTEVGTGDSVAALRSSSSSLGTGDISSPGSLGDIVVSNKHIFKY